MLFEPLQFKEFDSAGSSNKEARPKPFAAKKLKNDEPPPPPPPPTFSEEELAAAKRDAYQQGFLEGVQDGIRQTQSEQADIEKLLMERLESFASSINPIFERYKAHCQQLKNDMPPLALAIAKKVAGEAIASDHLAIITSASEQCVQAMISEPLVTITIHENLANVMTQKLQKLGAKVPATAHIEVVASENIPHGDYVIEWKNGSIERSTEKIWQNMEKAIANMLAMLANEKEEQLDLLNGMTR